jgi:hypothetical protein
MAAKNPYRSFVDGFVQLLREGGACSPTELSGPERPAVARDAPKALIFAPHPDDEVIIGGLPLRLLRELKIDVVMWQLLWEAAWIDRSSAGGSCKTVAIISGSGCLRPGNADWRELTRPLERRILKTGPHRSGRSPGY